MNLKFFNHSLNHLNYRMTTKFFAEAFEASTITASEFIIPTGIFLTTMVLGAALIRRIRENEKQTAKILRLSYAAFFIEVVATIFFAPMTDLAAIRIIFLTAVGLLIAALFTEHVKPVRTCYYDYSRPEVRKKVLEDAEKHVVAYLERVNSKQAA